MDAKRNFLESYWSYIKVAMIATASIVAFLLITQSNYFVVGILGIVCFVVFADARNRGLTGQKAYIWAYAVFMFLIIFLPAYIFSRPKKPNGNCPKCRKTYSDEQYCSNCGYQLSVLMQS